ncbi:hypothetical protein BDM02DRAFT_3186495 [Thelephora ganbajun]|uniref:Uncharacterized protein n=1 Tax=Thelephora ganbajun TaxID=370292 RepID=A0ACB6ZHX3_THEGA|nr:hypothetical protein BDM02DRAFT_3186495 [Thelephora ganbajun]
MPSDGRYMYPHQPPNMTYDYGAYPPGTYDNSQYPPNQPGVPQRPPHPPTYPPHYGPPPHYVIPQQQWETTWPPYSAPMHYPLVPGQPPPESVVPRPEVPTVETTRHEPQQPIIQPPKPLDVESQPPPNQINVNGNLNGSASQEKQKPYMNGSTHGAQLPEEFNFMKLLESYRLIMQSANMFNDEQIPNGVQRSPLDVLDKAISRADTSFSLLETLREPEQIQEIHMQSPVEMKIPESQGSSAEKATPSTDDSSQVPEGQTCLGCKATSTPEWRRGPMGPRTLCNACGLVYAKLIKRRGREARVARDGPNGGTGAEIGDDGLSGDDGGSDDDDDDGEETFSGEESHCV